MEVAEAYNPLNIVDFTPILEKNEKYGGWDLEGVTVQTPEGDYLYNEKDAEDYYDDYVTSFFFASKIATQLTSSSVSPNIREFVINNLFDIVCDLPLDNSYPNDVVEFANKIYYDNKDEAATLALDGRDYGSSEYVYGDIRVTYSGDYYQLSLRLSRDKDNGGRLIIR